MKEVYLSILFFLLANSVISQTIEVIVTDTIMCEVESYEYLLTVNFPWNSRIHKKKQFEDNLNSSNYIYQDFHGKDIVEEREGYIIVKYRIAFESLKQKLDFELKMNLEKQLYALELIEFRIKYEEKEKLRLLEKIIKKGEKEARLIAKGLGKELIEIKHISDSVDPRLRANLPENRSIGNYGAQRKKEPNIRNEAEKIKSLKITFNTN